MTAEATMVVLRIGDGLVRDLAADVLKENQLSPMVPAPGESIAGAVRRHGAEVAVLDLAGETSVDRVEQTVVDILAAGARVLLLADDASRDLVLAGLLAGASGHVQLCTISPNHFVRAVRQVADGDASLHPAVAEAVLQQWRTNRGLQGKRKRGIALSPREIEILGLAAEGLTAQAVARRLDVSLKTVENHKARIFAKLGVRNQTEAISVAMEQGLLRCGSEST